QVWIASSLPPSLVELRRTSRSSPKRPSHPRMRGVQYAAASRFHHRRLWNTGSPGLKPGDDDCGCGAFETVIASEAKQSIEQQERMDCFVASLLAMTSNTTPRSRGAMRPSFCKNVRPKRRGRGECRAPNAPAAS